jgi:hypothetical protein
VEAAEAAKRVVIPSCEETVRIAPAPTDDEAAAIVAALLLFEPIEESAPQSPTFSAWAMAGRRAAHLGREGGVAMGWGRAGDRRRR